MSESSAIAAIMDGELVSLKGTQEGKTTCYLVAIRVQALPVVSPGGTQNVKTRYWPQIAQVHIKREISGSLDFGPQSLGLQRVRHD